MCLAFTAFLSLMFACKTAKHGGGNDLESLNVDPNATDKPICKGEAAPEFKELFETLWPKEGADEQAKNSAPIVANAGYKPYLENILTAVPPGLLSWYFRSGGRLHLIEQGTASKTCSLNGSDQIMIPFVNEQDKIIGCVKSMGQSSSTKAVSMPVMFVEIDVTSRETVYQTASHTIQGFASIASFFTTELSVDKNNPNGTTLVFGNSELIEHKQNLAFFMTDDFANNGFTVPASLKEMFPEKKVWDKTVDRNTRWQAFTAQKKLNPVAYTKFVNSIFAQVLSADMCNAGTRQQISKEGSFASVGKQYFNAVQEPLMVSLNTIGTDKSVIAGGGNTTAADTSMSLVSSSSSKKAPVAATESTSFGLNDGVRFPVLHAVITAPFAVIGYFVENRPILTFFHEYKPIRSTLSFTFGTAIPTVVQGAGQVVGTVAHGTAQVAGTVVQGTGQVLGLVGRVATLPLRIIFGAR